MVSLGQGRRQEGLLGIMATPLITDCPIAGCPGRKRSLSWCGLQREGLQEGYEQIYKVGKFQYFHVITGKHSRNFKLQLFFPRGPTHSGQ